MSPEQAIGQMDHISFASDQFSLAVVGYELLTEKRPVTGKMMHLLDKLRDPSYQIVPLREQDKTIALGLEAILMKALQWKAVDRYASLAEMALDLHRWLKGDEVQAPILKGTKNWKCPSCQRMNARSKTRCVYCKHHLSGGVPADWTEQRVIPMTSRRIHEEQDDNEPHFRVRFWEWTWIVLSLLMLGMIPWLQRSDRESLETGRQFYALREVGQTLEQFMATFGHLPNNIVDKMTGEPLLSWRVAILPFMERDDLYRKFHLDEPWDSEHNKLLLAEMPEIFNSSIGSTWFASSTQAEPYFTTIQGITGKDALFEAGKKNKYQNIFDGTSNTLAIAEARKAVPWTKPDDLVLTKDQVPELGKPGRGMFQAVMCDGSVYQFNSKAESDKLRGIMTIAGGEFVDLNHLAPQQRITIPRIFTRKLSEHEPYRPQTKFPSLRPSHWSEFSGWLTYGVTEHGQTIWLIVLILLLLILAKLTWVWNFYRRQQPARKAKS